MVSLFFSLLKLHLKKKNIKTSTCFHFQGRLLQPNFMTINGKKQAFGCVFVAATPLKWWKTVSMHGICCWHWWGFPARLPNGDESRTKNSKFGKNNKKSGALVEVFQHILETKNSINSQSKTSLFTSQMRPFITKPWRQQNRRHRGCKI